MLTSSVLGLSIGAAASTRNAVTSQSLGPVQSPPPSPKAVLRIGKNRAFPPGTVQLRVAAPPNVPAKNHTWPPCPSAQCAPVRSRTGFVAAGIDSAHCHHRALHSPYVFP